MYRIFLQSLDVSWDVIGLAAASLSFGRFGKLSISFRNGWNSVGFLYYTE